MLRTYIRELIKEANNNKLLISERPWSVQFDFKMKGGDASDSEGYGPDGIQFIFKCDKDELKIIADSYWNPNTKDSSGNELKLFINNKLIEHTYVPIRFDDGKLQTLIVSNSPIENKIIILHNYADDIPIYYLSVDTPFKDTKPINVSYSALMEKGKKDMICKIVKITNL